MQNWNDGKSEEYRERNLYEPLHFAIEAKQAEKKAPHAEAPERPADTANSTFFLFVTKTCPNCRAAKRFLDEAGIAYTAIDADENGRLVRIYGVMQAPTLVIVNGAKISQYANVSAIRKYIEQAKVC